MKNPVLVSRAKKLRKAMTDEERILWSQINRYSDFIVKFRRQHIVAPYILDFYSVPIKLAIELDGGQHAEKRQLVYDEKRTAYLHSQGITVIRFWNQEIKEELNNCLEYLWDVCEKKLKEK